MGLAVLADAVGEGLEPPALDLGDAAAALFDDAFELLDKRFDLRAGDVLASQKDMLV